MPRFTCTQTTFDKFPVLRRVMHYAIIHCATIYLGPWSFVAQLVWKVKEKKNSRLFSLPAMLAPVIEQGKTALLFTVCAGGLGWPP